MTVNSTALYTFTVLYNWMQRKFQMKLQLWKILLIEGVLPLVIAYYLIFDNYILCPGLWMTSQTSSQWSGVITCNSEEIINRYMYSFDFCQGQGPTLGPTQGQVKVKVKVRT